MAVETAPATAAYDEWRDRRWRLTGLVFALAWLVAASAVLGAGEKRSDLDTLVAGVRAGAVASVEVAGDYGDETDNPVELAWQDGIVRRFAVVQVDLSATPDEYTTGDRITTSPPEFLRGLDPDLELSSVVPSGGATEWRGWRLPNGTGLLVLGTWLGTLLMALSGPEPWRATRWAWGWFILFSGPLGSVGYLLLGGPLGVGRPSNLTRRLTGGWALLLALALFGSSNLG